MLFSNPNLYFPFLDRKLAYQDSIIEKKIAEFKAQDLEKKYFPLRYSDETYESWEEFKRTFFESDYHKKSKVWFSGNRFWEFELLSQLNDDDLTHLYYVFLEIQSNENLLKLDEDWLSVGKP